MAIGAQRIARARRICWIAGVVAVVSVGAVASFIAVFPDIWVNLFTDDASVRAASRQYLSTAAPMYAFLGLSTTCYFSSQGAAKVIGPVLAQTARRLFIGPGGWWLSTHMRPHRTFQAGGSLMVLLGVLSCLSVMLTRWGPKQRAVPQSRQRCHELPPRAPPAVTAAADIGHAHQLRDHAHQLAAATAAEHAHEVAAAQATYVRAAGGYAVTLGHIAAAITAAEAAGDSAAAHHAAKTA
jgi:hypothetical protein